MNAKMYVTSVEKQQQKTAGKTAPNTPAGKTEPNPEPETDLVKLSALPSGIRDGSVIEAHPPAAETPDGQRPPVYGGGTGTVPSPDTGTQFKGEVEFIAPTGTVKVDQIYYVDLTPTGEMIPRRAEGEGKRPEGEGEKRR
jgi:hypothetical protein